MSYSEVKKFEMCATYSQGTDIPGITPGHLVQYLADNVDHNVRTMDGLIVNTFHGMGIIASVTPGTKRRDPVPRHPAPAKDVILKAKIDIHFFKLSANIVTNVIYSEQQPMEYVDQAQCLVQLWKLAWQLLSSRPGWSGMMQAVCQGTYPGEPGVTFLPMIDMSCIYLTLKFVCAEAKRHQLTPVITFDQPLWWKAQMIVASERDLQSMVLRLSMCHTKMSFLGSIGHVMSKNCLRWCMPQTQSLICSVVRFWQEQLGIIC